MENLRPDLQEACKLGMIDRLYLPEDFWQLPQKGKTRIPATHVNSEGSQDMSLVKLVMGCTYSQNTEVPDLPVNMYTTSVLPLSYRALMITLP